MSRPTPRQLYSRRLPPARAVDYVVGPARTFDPKFHVPELTPGYFLGNFYGLDDIANWPVKIPAGLEAVWQANPFYQFRRAYGSEYLQKLWEFAFTTPYSAGDTIFPRVLNSGLCTGLAAAIGHNFEEYRFGRRPKDAIKKQPPLETSYRALRAHLHVLSNSVLLHCKYYQCRGPASTFPDLANFFRDSRAYRPLLMLVPLFQLGDAMFEAKLAYSHTVFVHGAVVGPDSIKMSVWDGNYPEEAARPLVLRVDGGFEYTTRFNAPCLLSGYDVADRWEWQQGEKIPTRLGRMLAIPISVGAFPDRPTQYLDLLSLIVG